MPGRMAWLNDKNADMARFGASAFFFIRLFGTCIGPLYADISSK